MIPNHLSIATLIFPLVCLLIGMQSPSVMAAESACPGLDAEECGSLSSLQQNLLGAQTQAGFEWILRDLQRRDTVPDAEIELLQRSLSQWPEEYRTLPSTFLENPTDREALRGSSLVRSVRIRGSRDLLESLASTPWFVDLLGHTRHLDLAGVELGEAGYGTLVALYEQGALRNIRTLRLSLTGAEDTEADLLAKMGSLQLEALDLSWNEVSDQGIDALLASGITLGLRQFRLSGTKITSLALASLLNHPSMQELEALELAYVDFYTDSDHGPGLEAFRHPAAVTRLRHLHLSGTFGNEEVRAITESSALAHLEVLIVDGSRADLKLFLTSTALPSLEVLVLEGSGVCETWHHTRPGAQREQLEFNESTLTSLRALSIECGASADFVLSLAFPRRLEFLCVGARVLWGDPRQFPSPFRCE